MKYSQIAKLWSVVFCIVLLLEDLVNATPYYSDYDARDLYELLMQKEALNELAENHRMARKSARTPSLRLRFGRRSDPNMSSFQQSPTLRLRFGKRSEAVPKDQIDGFDQHFLSEVVKET
ncbi:short neuropeptide F isoform X2 [Bemisia tabaci]|uniref:short neuropeptide F isoform X2 n=1 Tax=Bemisia tabaci TaxID=7038 RepID=UPI0008F9B113|nr:PREDICTED: short neuropeptide F isoform X2 [Bemisia tabaci]